jgi:hypothetical protein
MSKVINSGISLEETILSICATGCNVNKIPDRILSIRRVLDWRETQEVIKKLIDKKKLKKIDMIFPSVPYHGKSFYVPYDTKTHDVHT